MKPNNLKTIITICSAFVSLSAAAFSVDEVNPDSLFAPFKMLYSLSKSAETENFAVSEYVKTCISTTEDALKKCVPVFLKLIGEPNSPITEDDPYTMESGYSFPPHMVVQGPLLQLCSKIKPIVFDIGPGSGNDSLMALFAGARQVIAVDIHEKQLAACKARVSGILEGCVELSKFVTVKRDFSVAGKVPTQYVGKIQVINANKVLHFLDESETTTFLANAHSMLEDGGHLFVTVSMPTQAHETAGVVYYSKTTVIQNRQIKSQTFTAISKEDSGLISPRFKREVVRQSGNMAKVIMYQGRHFHTLETLQTYLSPLFEIVDSTTINCGVGNEFLSVIARKVSAVR